MRVKSDLLICLLLLAFVLFSCASLEVDNTSKNVKQIEAIMTGAPDAITAVLACFQTSDIVFIGGSSHRLLNEILFVTENLERFYDVGVRYLLVEGGSLDDDPLSSIEELQQIGILLFYPWEYVGVRYTARDWGVEQEYGNTTYLINLNKELPETLKSVGLETGRRSSIPGSEDPWELLNYRGEYMANMAFNFIDNAVPGEKFLVLGGGAHGVTTRMEGVSRSFGPYNWKPLGAYLKEKYGKNFTSLCYITLDESIKMDIAYQGMLQSVAWHDMPAGPRLITLGQVEELQTVLPFEVDRPHDGYIVDKTGLKGILYQYALFKPQVLKEIINQTKQYEASVSNFSVSSRLDYEDVDTYYNIRNLLINVYYLRFFFGDYFPYDFWAPKISLKEALAVLETLVFIEGKDPVNLMQFPVPSVETMRSYLDNIEFFASVNGLLDINAERLFRLFNAIEPYMQKAQELFPYELWTDYWYAKMYTELKNYEKAYSYIQAMLNDPLIVSMQIYPEVLELAALVADQLGNREQSINYWSLINSLTNEFHIDTKHFSLFL